MPQRKRKDTRPDKWRVEASSAKPRARNSRFEALWSESDSVATYVNIGWQAAGCATVHLLRRRGERSIVMASFGVDSWCMGLRHVSGRLNYTNETVWPEFFAFATEHLTLKRIALREARSIVWTGVQFSEQNGFLLPPRCGYRLLLLGGAREDGDARLKRFGLESGPRFFGSRAELAKRRIDGDADAFLSRPDVEHIDDSPPPSRQSMLNELLDQTMLKFSMNVIEGSRRWCCAKGEAPSPLMAAAADLFIDCTLMDHDAEARPAPGESAFDFVRPVIGSVLRLFEPQAALEMNHALEQVFGFVTQHDSLGLLFQTCGLTLESIGVTEGDEKDMKAQFDELRKLLYSDDEAL